MKKQTKLIMLAMVLIILPRVAICTDSINNHPKIGQKCPDFVLDSLDHFDKSVLHLDSYKGKWVVLDFWGEYCGGCISSFPKLKEMDGFFRDKKVQFILVTKIYKNIATARNLYERIRAKLELDIPISYDQDIISNFKVAGLPTIIVIDPNGIVRAITSKITIEDITNFLNGKDVPLKRSYLLGELPGAQYNNDLPLLIKNNGAKEDNFITRTIVTNWNSEMPIYRLNIFPGRFEVIGCTLESLINLAYIGKDYWTLSDTAVYGKFYIQPITDSKKSSGVPNSILEITKFCYSYCFPKDKYNLPEYAYDIVDKPELQNDIKLDLLKYFGVSAQFEKRKVPCYKLVALEGSKKLLSTKGGVSEITYFNGRKSLKGRNISISNVLSMLYGSSNAKSEEYIFEDNTGINYNIDITIDAIYFDDWVKALKRYRLDVIESEKEIKVLVINFKEDPIQNLN